MRIGAIFLYYGRWDWARETLEMLLGGSRAPDHVVVVDNGSGDGSADRAREAYPGLEVVELAANVGPSAGMNAGLKALSGRDDLDLVQLVPSDCRLAPDALELLAARIAQDESLGAVGPLLAWLDDPDRVWSAGGNIHPRNWDTGHTGVPGTVSEWRGRPPREADWLDGTGMLMRMAAVRQVGLLPEKFFYFFDETDYGIQMRERGWRLECVPAAVAWQEAGTPNPYVFARNRLGFLARRAPRRFLARELVRVGWYIVRDAVRPRPGHERRHAWLRLRGVVDFARGRWGPPPPDVSMRSGRG